MLKVALPRPSPDAVIRGDGRPLSARPFDDEADEAPIHTYTRAEAREFEQRQPQLSPWRVVLAQAAVGIVVAAITALFAGRVGAASALYGAAVVAIPGALMARGATSRLSSISPLVSAVSMMGWATAKIATSVAMLALAPRIVPGLVWPALLVALVVCTQTYGFALLWRGRPN